MLYTTSSFEDIPQDILGLVASSLPSPSSFFKVCKSVNHVSADTGSLLRWLLQQCGPLKVWDKFSLVWDASWSERKVLSAVTFFMDNAADVAYCQPAFAKAAQLNCVEVCKVFLAARASVTPVVFESACASERGHCGVIQLLLANGAALAACDWSALRAAAFYGRVDALRLLLPLVPASIKSYIQDALLVTAASQGCINVVQLLMEKDEGAPTAGKDAALLAAARSGCRELVELLLLKGADVHAQGDLALRQAAEFADQNHKAVVELLLEKGADVHTHHDSPLLAAAVHGHHDVVALLLLRGADVHAQQDMPLVKAALHGHKGVVELLLGSGATPTAQQGMALIRAASHGHSEVVDLLIKHGADVHAQYDSAIVAGASAGHGTVVASLLEAGADVHAEEEGALCGALRNGRVDVMRTLLQYGADAAALEDDMEAVCTAAATGHCEALSVVFDQGVSVHSWGLPLLSVAAKAGQVEVVSLLLSKGAAEYAEAVLECADGLSVEIVRLLKDSVRAVFHRQL